jgi:hypothetical protein
LNIPFVTNSGRRGKWLLAAAGMAGAVVYMVKNPKYLRRAKSLATGSVGQSMTSGANDAGLADMSSSQVPAATVSDTTHSPPLAGSQSSAPSSAGSGVTDAGTAPPVAGSTEVAGDKRPAEATGESPGSGEASSPAPTTANAPRVSRENDSTPPEGTPSIPDQE